MRCAVERGETSPEALRQTLGKGYVWVYAGDVANPYTAFDFTPDRSRDGPKRFLGNYRGYLQCDAYSGYDMPYERNSEGRRRIYEVGCWAHARRYFYDARRSGGRDTIEALAMIARLYHVEHEAKERKLEGIALSAYRRGHAAPVLKAFRRWLEARRDARTGILPKSALGEAITYAARTFKALRCYTMRGHLSIDNNAVGGADDAAVGVELDHARGQAVAEVVAVGILGGDLRAPSPVDLVIAAQGLRQKLAARGVRPRIKHIRVGRAAASRARRVRAGRSKRARCQTAARHRTRHDYELSKSARQF